MKRNPTKSLPIQIANKNINFKNVLLLRKFINPEGKILPKRLTKIKSKQQRKIRKAVKISRIVGFLPFVNITYY